MSIQLRLNIVIGVLFALTLAGLMMAVMLDAGPRLSAENDSIMRLTQTIVKSSVTTLEHAAEPQKALRQLVDELSHLRHAEVELASARPIGNREQVERASSGLWRSLLRYTEPQPIRLPVTVAGRSIDTVVITPRPADELSELGDANFRIAQYGLALGIIVITLTSLLIRHSLLPLQALSNAMESMQSGDYSVKIDTSGPPEIATMCARLNELAAALQASQAENQRLSVSMLNVQDAERRDIARELHDDLGPYLFSLRAAGASLQRELGKADFDIAKAVSQTRDIAQHVEALQKTNRRVLNRLSPIGLLELGLQGALQGMVALWNKERPAIATSIAIAGVIDDLDETLRLTIFRTVQEGLTNAHRHANANQIDVDIVRRHVPNAGSPGETITITIRDNGIGLSEQHASGFGLAGMKERIAALGGRYTFESGAQGGAVLQAVLPRKLLTP